jgi:hypothetical protein
MRILVACEFSGRVREAFRKRGHDAWSCDLLPSDDKSPYHIQGDVLDYLDGMPTMCVDGGIDFKWDLLIAHPPCTYLCNSGVCWLYNKDKSHNLERWRKLKRAMLFFKNLKNTDCFKVAVENPIPHKWAVNGHFGINCPAEGFIEGIGKYDQIIHPYMFGHPERKATCLWLKGLPKLAETNNVKEEMLRLPKSKSQRLHWASPGPDRWKIRSTTYQGIADAMAEQWG